MKRLLLVALGAWAWAGAGGAAAADLPAPRFHHIHLNARDPEAAIAFYIKAFPTTSRVSWQGKPALSSPDDVLIVFDKVASPPKADPEQTAYWHFGWNVVDARASLATFKDRLVPFYTGDGGGFVGISSDTYPYPPGVPGRTRAQLAEAQAQNLQPRRVGGNGYIAGPDKAVIEFTGNAPAERIDHVHMWQEEPLCAQAWYTRHLDATPRRGIVPPTEADCRMPRGADRSWPSLNPEGTYRSPTGGVSFSGVAMNWYPNQTGRRLVSTRGHLIDHVGLSVTDLDAWIARFKREGVPILKRIYRIGSARAVMIEGPSHEAIELVEAR
ncbi:VOC family protein [Glacieibacterium sp.]|uniref:VOC family protein n=1 Tax=Glacieibacterium sp. TaxID=2860237 RepID=UPI003B00F5E1